MLGLRAVDGLRAAVCFIILLIILPDKNETPPLDHLGQKIRAYSSQEEPSPPLPLQPLGNDVLCKLSEQTFADVQPWDFLRPPTNRYRLAVKQLCLDACICLCQSSQSCTRHRHALCSFFTYEADEPIAADSLNPLGIWFFRNGACLLSDHV
jgi:hypothetical protein